MNIMKNRLILIAVAVASMAALSCSSELTDNAAPVELVVTNTQNLTQLDLDPLTRGRRLRRQTSARSTCRSSRRTRAPTGNFVQVRVQRYRVSYRRTDGGTAGSVAVRPLDRHAGRRRAATRRLELHVIEADALSQAPFAALQPQNGGRDPETGRPVVKLEVILEVFGETLAGDNVYDSTAFPLEFCYGCGGCA